VADAQTFQCPSCAAILRVTGDAATVRCEYCGNTVEVPAELRPAPRYVPPTYVTAPPPTYVLAPNSMARTASLLGTVGLVLSCLFWPVGALLCVIALVLAWQYQRQLAQTPGAIPHPDDAGRIRASQVTATVGLVLTGLLCSFLTFLSGVGLFVTTTGTPTPLP
jgi:hypothetical protein